jgi:hypothetical protein
LENKTEENERTNTMTETREQELLPCYFCGNEPALEKYINGFRLICLANNIDGITSHCVYVDGDTEAETRAAWNRRVAVTPAPQWTEEPPKEEGWYWVANIEETVITAEVYDKYSSHKGLKVMLHRSKTRCGHVDDEIPQWEQLQNICEEHPEAQWLRIPAPPLPAEREEHE